MEQGTLAINISLSLFVLFFLVKTRQLAVHMLVIITPTIELSGFKQLYYVQMERAQLSTIWDGTGSPRSGTNRISWEGHL